MVFMRTFLTGVVGAFLGMCSMNATERQSDWYDAEKKAQNAVVQIMAQHMLFDWVQPYKSPRQKSSSGTGFFINKDGYIITNFHVVDQSKSLQVFLPAMGQKPLNAHIVGVCPEIDVAYLKLSNDALKSVRTALNEIPYLEFGDSDSLFPTEPVLALGYPLGQRYIKSTVGVIAGREYIDGRSYMHITAPINPGNSGGPLLNLDGRVVGINSAGIPGAQNIGYIVPIFDVNIVLKDLARQALVRKPYSGIYYNATTDEHAQLLGNPVPAGVYIHAVEQGSNAHKAGIKEGDMLYTINGYHIDSYGDVTVYWPGSVKVSLEEFLVRLPSKTKITLEVYRSGHKKKITYSLDAPQNIPIRHVYPDHEPQEADFEVIGGMCIMQLRLNHLDDFRMVAPLQKYRLLKNRHKQVLIITKLLPGSVFHKACCFYEGTLLKKVNGQKVKTLHGLRNALKKSVDTGYVRIKTKDNRETADSLNKILQDEERLTESLKFTSTKAMQWLKNASKGLKA